MALAGVLAGFVVPSAKALYEGVSAHVEVNGVTRSSTRNSAPELPRGQVYEPAVHATAMSATSSA